VAAARVKARLLLNPAAGRGRGARRRAGIEALARRHGLAMVESTDSASVAELARQSAADGCERLFVAGGDGTWHHAAQSLAKTDCALVPVAVGTGNDLARELGLPLDAPGAIEAGLGAPLDSMDLGRAAGRWFCGVAGSGIDSEAAEYSLSIRRLRGPLVYVLSVLVVFSRFRAPRLDVELDGRPRAGRVLLVACANTRFFGGGMKIAPAADRRDGLFDVVRVGEVSRAAFLSIFPRVYRGRHAGHPACSIERAARVSLRFDREMACWGDGERLARIGPDGLELEIVPAALRVPDLRLDS
jgi:diacylglycerol kinase (ATP)